ncbi:hypothetical protein [Halothiobacillus sp.]|uniref:hypothetical protein n=1 Tax=Halothiobacillus sp. TaxID=1891311 RepID=UPI002AD404C5|nr:hypothetical protein [Halothiobacillus sp.]
MEMDIRVVIKGLVTLFGIDGLIIRAANSSWLEKRSPARGSRERQIFFLFWIWFLPILTCFFLVGGLTKLGMNFYFPALILFPAAWFLSYALAYGHEFANKIMKCLMAHPIFSYWIGFNLESIRVRPNVYSAGFRPPRFSINR